MTTRRRLPPDGWQHETFRVLRRLVDNDDTVEVTGSLATSPHAVDPWSDLDVRITSRRPGRYAPSIDWLADLGEVYAVDQSAEPAKATTRLVLRDLRRIDIAVVPADGAAIQPGPASQAAGDTEPPRSPRLAKLTDEFRFVAVLAAAKIARDDLLIGWHLTLELTRTCLVVGMLLRDAAGGTAHHPRGGALNEVLDALQGAQRPYTGPGALEAIEETTRRFEELATRLDPTHRPDAAPIMDLVALCRSSLRDRAGRRPAP